MQFMSVALLISSVSCSIVSAVMCWTFLSVIVSRQIVEQPVNEQSCTRFSFGINFTWKCIVAYTVGEAVLGDQRKFSELGKEKGFSFAGGWIPLFHLVVIFVP
jgi:hypothetical protein